VLSGRLARMGSADPASCSCASASHRLPRSTASTRWRATARRTSCGVRHHAQDAGSSAILPDLSAGRSRPRDPRPGRLPIVHAIGLNAFGWQSRDSRQNDGVKLEFVSRQNHDDDVELADPRQKRREPRLVPVVKNRLSSRFGGDSSVRERDLDAGAAQVDHRDERVGGVESVCAV